ncbi:MAG: FABP family protein [Jatrophihabitans sp.]
MSGPAADTSDLRQGAPLHDDLLALLPLVGVWRGSGEGVVPRTQERFRYRQELVFAHDGRPFLAYEGTSWIVDDAGAVVRPAARERGFWRPGPGPDDVAVVLSVASGFSIVFTGAVSDLRWEISSTSVGAAPGAKDVAGERRLYALVGDGLGYAAELDAMGLGFRPHLTAQLKRVPPGAG